MAMMSASLGSENMRLSKRNGTRTTILVLGLIIAVVSTSRTAIAGDWKTAMTEHFASGGKLDQLQRR